MEETTGEGMDKLIDWLIDWTLLKRTYQFSQMFIMALGRCSCMFSEGVAFWDETDQCIIWYIGTLYSFKFPRRRRKRRRRF
jgi:hypothetical protein